MRARPTRFVVGNCVWYYSPRRYVGRPPKWQRNDTGPFQVVGALSAVNVATQKSKRADRLIVHIDKPKPYMGDAPAAWVVGDSLDATDESLTEFSIPPDFTRASIPADPDGTDIESEHEVGSRPSSVGNPSTPSPGREENSDRECAMIPLWQGTDLYGCVTHPPTYAISSVGN